MKVALAFEATALAVHFRDEANLPAVTAFLEITFCSQSANCSTLGTNLVRMPSSAPPTPLYSALERVT